MKLIKRLFAWLKRFWNWLGEGKAVFIGLLVLVPVLFYPDTWRSEDSIRIAGYLLQIAGMILAIIGLLNIRKHFGLEPLWQVLVDWLKRFPKWRRDLGIVAEKGEVDLVGFNSHFDAWAPDMPEQPIEKRIEEIVNNLEQLRAGQREHHSLLVTMRSNLEKHKIIVAEENEKTKMEIQEDLETLHTGGIITALAGLVWLTVGISMSTMDEELFLLIQ